MPPHSRAGYQRVDLVHRIGMGLELCETRSANFISLEMRILNDAEEVAEWVAH